MADLERAIVGPEHSTIQRISEATWTANNSSCVTLQNLSSEDSACDLNVEAQFKPALHHELDLRQDLKETETAQISEELPDLRRLAWIRFAIINVYRRLFSLAFCSNLAAFIWFISENRGLLQIIDAAAANLLVLGLARQPLVVNSLFLLFGSVSRSAPLRLRRTFAKIYCYGGIHSGCGIASLLWYIAFVARFTQQYASQARVSLSSRALLADPSLLALSYIILVLLLAIIIAAYPKIRFMMHDYFELTHRFCGWTVVALFWPLLILASHKVAEESKQSLGQVLVAFPTFWFLIITSLAIIHPWMLLRRVAVAPENLSTHAIRLHFHHTLINFGQGIQLSKHPLKDWHSFASFPDIPSRPGTNGSLSKSDGFSCLISKAGDWTSDTITNPPTHLWKRGVPIYGFGYAMRVFRSIVVVTTGSGIGPCLSFLGDPDRPKMRVLWQSKSVERTYGRPVIELVRQLDPNTEIIDTGRNGRQEMLPLVLRMVRELDAEAVCVISNPLLTRKLVFECESRGIPAFGPIFDS